MDKLHWVNAEQKTVFCLSSFQDAKQLNVSIFKGVIVFYTHRWYANQCEYLLGYIYPDTTKVDDFPAGISGFSTKTWKIKGLRQYLNTQDAYCNFISCKMNKIFRLVYISSQK